MIKFRATSPEGKPIIGIGISAENVKLLKQGKPILTELDAFGIEADFVLWYKETEAELHASIRERPSMQEIDNERTH